VNEWKSEYTVTERVRDGCGIRKEHGKIAEADRKWIGRALEWMGSRKDLASTRALRPRAHRCPILESRADRKRKQGEPKSIFRLEIQEETPEYIN